MLEKVVIKLPPEESSTWTLIKPRIMKCDVRESNSGIKAKTFKEGRGDLGSVDDCIKR